MSLSEVGSLHEDQYLSDDSESTSFSTYSDLDYNLAVDVLLPNGSIQKTSIPAHISWSDVRARMCAQFKLNPTNHVVDFVSNSALQHKKRRASRPVGKMDINMISIKEKGHAVKHAAPRIPPVVSADKGSVRLIVRLPRSRQSILRVNPDAPLSNIFSTVSNKLKLGDQSKSEVEFRHPLQHDVKLDSQFSLNQYNLREVYLTEKSEQTKATSALNPAATSHKTKRRAPPPPRPPPPNLSARSKSTSSTESKLFNPPTTEEPVYAQVQKKPKPMKRKTAPVPPQRTTSPDEETAKSENSPTTPLHEQNGQRIAPSRNPKKRQDVKNVFADHTITDGIQNDVIQTQEQHDIVDDVNVYATIADIGQVKPSSNPADVTEETTNAKENNLDAKANNDVIKKSDDKSMADNDVFDRALQSIDEAVQSDSEQNTESEEDEDDDVIDAIDDAFEQLDNGALTDDASDDEKSAEEQSKESKTITGDDNKNGKQSHKDTDNIETLSSTDEQRVVMANDDKLKEEEASFEEQSREEEEAKHEVPEEQLSSEESGMEETSTDVQPLKQQEMKHEEDLTEVQASNEKATAEQTEQTSVQLPAAEALSQSDVATSNAPNKIVQPSEPTDINSSLKALQLDDNAIADSDVNDNKHDEDAAVWRKSNIDEPKPSTDMQPKDVNEVSIGDQGDDFDLHIAESFNIPLQSLDEKMPAKEEPKQNEETATKENHVAQPKKIENKNPPQQVPAVKSAQELENEKTAKEIAKLHQQIRKMKTRNSVKQMDANASRNSFTFIPTKKRESLHDDYNVAPVGAIQLSNSGEIKALQKDEKAADPGPVLHAEALKHKNNLPGYYKKFLGVQAFAAKDSK